MKKTMLLSCLVFISLKSNSQSWQQLTLGVDDEVYAICHYNNLLIAGGSFLNTSGVPSNRIAAWNGVIWSSLGSGMNNKVYALCVYAGQLYAGGNFTIAGGVPCSRIARWDGIAWSPVGLGMNEQVNCLYVWNGNLYAGGDFTNARMWEVKRFLDKYKLFSFKLLLVLMFYLKYNDLCSVCFDVEIF
jgi:hypothetical protein